MRSAWQDVFWSSDQFPAVYYLSDLNKAFSPLLLLSSMILCFATTIFLVQSTWGWEQWQCSAEIYLQGIVVYSPQPKIKAHRHQRGQPSPTTIPKCKSNSLCGDNENYICCLNAVPYTPKMGARQNECFEIRLSDPTYSKGQPSPCELHYPKPYAAWLWFQLLLLSQLFHLVGKVFYSPLWNILPVSKFLHGVFRSKPFELFSHGVSRRDVHFQGVAVFW